MFNCEQDMETQYLREQAQRVRDIAERADPFTKKRLLTLAEHYDARALESSRPFRSTHFRLRPSERAI
jgi:hypothetical protein